MHILWDPVAILNNHEVDAAQNLFFLPISVARWVVRPTQSMAWIPGYIFYITYLANGNMA